MIIRRKKTEFSKTSNRVQHINRASDLEMFKMTHFARLPAIFEVTLVVQFQKTAKIRHDNGTTHHFGETEQWNQQSQK